MSQTKQVQYDVDGYDVLTAAIRELLNQYPGLAEGECIAFSTLEESGGVAMFPISGAVIESETRNILGQIAQVCLYPFCVVYRVGGLSGERKAAVKEWLDSLGLWLEQKPVTIDGTESLLPGYPTLTQGRSSLSITRQSRSYLEQINENQSEDWVIYLSARYRYESK